MARLDALTTDQIAQLPAIRDEWIRIGLSTEPADRPRAEAAVALAYQRADLPRPRQVLWLGSPMGGALAYAIFTHPDLSVGASIRDSVRASVRA